MQSVIKLLLFRFFNVQLPFILVNKSLLKSYEGLIFAVKLKCVFLN